MTPLAIIAKEAGMEVSGSDVDKKFITDSALSQAGITEISSNFSSVSLDKVDLVITTIAHNGLNNPEVSEAKKRNIPVWTQAQAVGEFMNGSIFGGNFMGISITGTHGKTTTTAMAATLLQQLKLDPSYIIGTSSIDSLQDKLPGYLGKGKYFIAEADEYVNEYEENGQRKAKTKFLWQHPKYLIMTSLELDHPDVYSSIEEIKESFLAFAKQLPAEGVFIYNGDDVNLSEIAKRVVCKTISYGFSKNNDYFIDKSKIEETIDGIKFKIVVNHSSEAVDFSLQIPGEHNALNALAVICLAGDLGLSFTQAQSGLQAFKGSKRRLEKISFINPSLPQNVIYYDDYAHHPTEIKATLRTLRSMYPHNYIICIFQPHTYSRTKALFNDFAHAFSGVDEVVLTDIFASAREQNDDSVSSKMLASAIEKAGGKVLYESTLSDVIKYLQSKNYPANTVVVTMGAGDVYKILS